MNRSFLEALMVTLVNLITIVTVTFLAAAAAVAIHWLLLRATVQFMRPATARQASVRSELVRGTAELARAFTPHR